MVKALKWSVELSGDVLTVHLNGDIDENADLYDLHPQLRGKVVLDLGGVRRINSAGVREWVNFIHEAEPLTDGISLLKCSPAIVMQMNMISNFRGTANVSSFFAPLVCPACHIERDELIELTPELAAALPGELPEFKCPKCGALLELDDIPERYFAFLKL